VRWLLATPSVGHRAVSDLAIETSSLRPGWSGRQRRRRFAHPQPGWACCPTARAERAPPWGAGSQQWRRRPGRRGPPLELRERRRRQHRRRNRGQRPAADGRHERRREPGTAEDGGLDNGVLAIAAITRTTFRGNIAGASGSGIPTAGRGPDERDAERPRRRPARRRSPTCSARRRSRSARAA
jgi:hypothetical protein